MITGEESMSFGSASIEGYDIRTHLRLVRATVIYAQHANSCSNRCNSVSGTAHSSMHWLTLWLVVKCWWCMLAYAVCTSLSWSKLWYVLESYWTIALFSNGHDVLYIALDFPSCNNCAWYYFVQNDLIEDMMLEKHADKQTRTYRYRLIQSTCYISDWSFWQRR